MISIAAFLPFLVIPVGLSLAALAQIGAEQMPVRVSANARSEKNPSRRR